MLTDRFPALCKQSGSEDPGPAQRWSREFSTFFHTSCGKGKLKWAGFFPKLKQANSCSSSLQRRKSSAFSLSKGVASMKDISVLVKGGNLLRIRKSSL